MARHLAPFSWRQRMAEMVRRRSFGCVLPLGRHASTNGSKFVHCASDTIALSSFQKEQNARHHKQFKREQALGHLEKFVLSGCEVRCLGEKRFSRVLKGALSRSRGWVALAKECLRRRWAPAWWRCALSPAMRVWPSAPGRPIG